MTTLHITIHGRVQGVGYRAWAVGRAKAHGVQGWVRNRTDGSVEAVFHGEEEQVHALLAECRKGPVAARVSEVAAYPYEEQVQFSGFEQWPTARAD